MTLTNMIIDEMKTRHAQQERVSLALSGGSSPVALYERLAQAPLDWHNIDITLIDDRLVAPDHADSNQLLIHETLLQNEAQAARFIPLEAWPLPRIPDIAILGMGEDGHFASLFPAMLKSDQEFGPDSNSKDSNSKDSNSKAFDPKALPAILTTPPQGTPKHPRITMSLSMILAIPFRVLMVLGEAKQKRLDQALNGDDLPITRLLNHPGTQIVKTPV